MKRPDIEGTERAGAYGGSWRKPAAFPFPLNVERWALDVGCCRRRSPPTRGSALIVVLWVVALLSMMVGSFAFDAHIEARITSYYRKRAKAEYLAESGIEIAKMLMVKSGEIQKDAPASDEAKEDRWYDAAKLLADNLVLGREAKSVVEEKLGEGTITVEIMAEQARRNINNLGRTDQEREENLERILEVAGVPEALFPTLIDSYLDWTDADDIQRADGGEDDHYGSLESPYKVKNGPLDTTGELLLVKGFTKTILYGGTIETGRLNEEPVMTTGIDDMLTTYGDGKVNVNAASPRVLRTLPGVTEDLAGAIIEEREGWYKEGSRKQDTSFKSPEDLVARIPELGAGIKDWVTTASGIYRITSVGNVGGVRFEIWCIVQRGDSDFTVLRWREEK